MKVLDWLNGIISSGDLCKEYADKVEMSKSKKALMDVVLDSNGSTWLCEMAKRGNALPYEYITQEFGSFINGRYVGEFKKEDGKGYTSSLYCCYSFPDLMLDTTITTLLGCETKITIRQNDFVKIVLDTNCDVDIYCPISSRCIIECFGNAKADVLCLKKENVKIIKH